MSYKMTPASVAPLKQTAPTPQKDNHAHEAIAYETLAHESYAHKPLDFDSHSPQSTALIPMPIDELPRLMQRFYGMLEQRPRLHAYQQTLQGWDTRWCLRVNLLSQARQGQVGRFFKLISRLGDGWFWAASLFIMMAMLMQQGLTSLAVILTTLAVVSASFCGYLLYKFLKVHTVRPRPYQVHQAIMQSERPLDVFSFPSGHTLQAMLFTIMIGMQVPMLLWVLVPFTVLVAMSRMVLGLHYPTDVLVGAGIGASFAFLGSQLIKLI